MLLLSRGSSWQTRYKSGPATLRASTWTPTALMAYLGDDGDTIIGGRLLTNDEPAVDEQTTKRDFTGAGTLGDIMSDESQFSECGLSNAGLVTLDGGTLAARFGITSRLDRMALTANGNLQRLFSSYYDAPVHVVVDSCEQKTLQLWDRVVHLTVLNQVRNQVLPETQVFCDTECLKYRGLQVFCSAHSIVTIHDPACQDLVQSGKVGLGQLFRYLDRLPTFELLDAGYLENGALWRLYELKCKEVSCRIREDFHPCAWEIVDS